MFSANIVRFGGLFHGPLGFLLVYSRNPERAANEDDNSFVVWLEGLHAQRLLSFVVERHDRAQRSYETRLDLAQTECDQPDIIFGATRRLIGAFETG